MEPELEIISRLISDDCMSACFHEVAPVECATDDFGDGRFTVNGWFRSRGEGQDADQSSRAASPPPTP